MHKLIGQFACAIEVPIGLAPLNDDVFPFDVTQLAQTLLKCLDASRESGRRNIEQESDVRNFRRLCLAV